MSPNTLPVLQILPNWNQRHQHEKCGKRFVRLLEGVQKDRPSLNKRTSCNKTLNPGHSFKMLGVNSHPPPPNYHPVSGSTSHLQLLPSPNSSSKHKYKLSKVVQISNNTTPYMLAVEDGCTNYSATIYGITGCILRGGGSWDTVKSF